MFAHWHDIRTLPLPWKHALCQRQLTQFRVTGTVSSSAHSSSWVALAARDVFRAARFHGVHTLDCAANDFRRDMTIHQWVQVVVTQAPQVGSRYIMHTRISELARKVAFSKSVFAILHYCYTTFGFCLKENADSELSWTLKFTITQHCSLQESLRRRGTS